ncbi:uncharacterized protein Nmag_1579 [Natrialba magadii ATCC 43099]|uniref:Uncharacterized protein n=1 Tax=Natrialba magadii (strain ATCC 43099 / DSM 3394 / CCM 3739 / CIP 104546 / IAM 13178 / JCM 8861 / NBRC 102185 / NCIMB 2190 / MS3) TaxID=547559 RepID=D3SU97_NATMM|nr:DUF5518 domain-containing protein [Natrialba magadii]ADD05155.1 uncharacterized protein Nmag_1579 [Natrialba magadii ATCC 43099]ELY23193.1 hypothetical protein C500_20426 [Natrialba magadii ATCC 43099]
MTSKIRVLTTESIPNAMVSAAVFWGAVVCAIVNVIELEYNIAALVTPSTPSAGSGQIIGGLIAGYLYTGTRREALQAGGYAGSLPILVFGPVALVLHIGTQATAFTLEYTLLQYAFGFLLVYPFMICVGFLFGGIGGFVGHWISKTLT